MCPYIDSCLERYFIYLSETLGFRSKCAGEVGTVDTYFRMRTVRKNGGNVQGPGLLLMKNIRCGAVNAREEAMEFLSFR